MTQFTIRELIELKESPSLFAERILGLELHSGQKTIIESNARFQAVSAPRRWGKSQMAGALACHLAATNENCRIVCVSKAKRQADELFQKIYQLIIHSPLVKYLVRNTLSKIQLSNGSVIESLPSRNPDALRGPTIHLLIIDEAAYCSPSLFESIYPTILNVRGKTIGRLLMISTPRYTSGDFWKAFQPGSMFTAFHFTHDDALFSDGSRLLPDEELEREALRVGGRDTAYFKREYLGLFNSSDDAFFDIDGVDRALIPDMEQLRYGIPDHKYVLGVDLAVKNDYTIFVVLDYTKKDHLKVVRTVRFHGKSPDQIMVELYKEVMAFNPTNILIDEGNIGSAIVSQLKIRYPGKHFTGFQFTTTSKVPLMTDLNIAMCTGILQIPEEDQIREELVSFYYEENPTTGHLKLNGANSHDDYPIAIALAIRAANIFTKSGGLTIGSNKGILTSKGAEFSIGYNSSAFV